MAKQKSPLAYTLSGRITAASGTPRPDLIVRAFDQDPKSDNPLGKEATTNADGFYRIEYTESDFRLGGKESGGPDVFIRVFEGKTLLAESEVRRNAGRETSIDLSIAPKEIPLSPEARRRLDALTGVLPELQLSEGLTKALTAARGNWTVAMDTLRAEGAPEAPLQRLHFAHQVAEISADNAALVAVFHRNDKTNRLADVARLSRHQLEEAINTAGVPEDTTGETSDQRLNNYLGGIQTRLFRAEPTAMLHRMVRDAEIPAPDVNVRSGATAFFERQPELNLRTTSIYTLLESPDALKDIAPEHQESVANHLKNLQRVLAVSHQPEVIKPLMEAGLTSAYAINEIPANTFVAQHATRLGGEENAKRVHQQAQNIAVRNAHSYMAMRETLLSPSIAAIDGGKSVEERKKIFMDLANGVVPTVDADGNPIPVPYDTPASKIPANYEALFGGGVDMCECDHCNSVYSLAAYLVESFQFLRNNNLDPDDPNTNVKGIAGTPLEQFFRRRPDLAKMQLTCENTNTVQPYIDLTKEVMESFVVHLDQYATDPNNPKQATLESHDVEDETSGELLSEPQHTNYDAYCILKKAVYPFTLPYHQPIDAARLYLDYLGTSRYEVLDTFRRSVKPEIPDNATPEQVEAANKLVLYENTALDRAADAEYLGLTQEEYIILVKEAFHNRNWYDIKGGYNLTEEEYRKKIGVKEVWEYYGFAIGVTDTYSDVLDDLPKVKPAPGSRQMGFLRRTGIQYTDLVELLKTRFINPNYPKGKALSILSRIHYSYRYLQTLVDGSSTEWKVRYAKVIQLLEEQFKQDNTCDCEDVKGWVCRYFEKIGKLIVLESEAPCPCVEGQFLTNMVSNVPIPLYFVGADAIGTEGFLFLNANCEIEFQTDIGEGLPRTVIGRVEQSSGVLIGGQLEGRTIDFNQNQLQERPIDFKTRDGRIGRVSAGKLLEVSSQQPFGCVGDIKDTCDLTKVRLQHLDGTALEAEEYDRIHRFLRLWRKLGWTIDEVDKAIVGLGAYQLSTTVPPSAIPGTITDDTLGDDCCDDCADDEDCAPEPASNVRYGISPDFLHQLVAVKKLYERTGIELIKLLSFWADISTLGEKSLYKRLFLTHNLLGMDKVFQEDSNGNYLTTTEKITAHIPVLMAGLRVKAGDIEDIMAHRQMPDELTLDNVSMLYRYSLLAKNLSLRMPDLIRALDLIAPLAQPFRKAHETLTFYDIFQRVEDAGFNIHQLNYVIRDVDNDRRPLRSNDRTIFGLAISIRDALIKIETDHPDIKDDLEATDELIRSKLALLYEQEMIDQVLGLVNGVTSYTDNTRHLYSKNLPDAVRKTINDAFKAKQKDEEDRIKNLPEGQEGTPGENTVFLQRVKFADKTGLQITGLLSEADQAKVRSLTPDGHFQIAVKKMLGQPEQFFDKALSDVFATDISGAKAKLLSPDVVDALEQDNNTAPQKRAFFIKIFLPYLREQLRRRQVTQLISGILKTDTDVTRLLIMQLIAGTDGKPAYEQIAQLRAQPDTNTLAGNTWQGFLLPIQDGEYSFYLEAEGSAILQLDGKTLWQSPARTDDENIAYYQSAPMALKAGHAYPFAISGYSTTDKGQIQYFTWKIDEQTPAPVPSSALLPGLQLEAFRTDIGQLQKAALVIAGFGLSVEEIVHLTNHAADFDQLDFNAGKFSLQHFLRLEGYTRLRASLPQNKLNLLDFFRWTYQPDNPSLLSEKIALLSGWRISDINKLIDSTHYGLNDVAHFHNEVNVLKLQNALVVAEKIGMDINHLFEWAKPTSKFKPTRLIADSIRQAIRARYSQEEWEQAIKPVHDKLRNNQKEALIAYLLVQKSLLDWGVQDADSLFEFFLIDVQMDACMETSRIKQAISSVQLYVQRCFLGLEAPYVPQNILDRDRWEWMKNYRVWEANRKVFLYPENWIEPELRDDKSPFFKELESELLQKDISEENVKNALYNYIYKLDEVANLQPVGLHVEYEKLELSEKDDISRAKSLHFFGRTRNAPYFFFYRRFDYRTKYFTAWGKVQVDIPCYDHELNDGKILGNGAYLVPVVWNNRLLIFFPQIMKKTFAPTLPDSINGGGVNKVNLPTYAYEIKIAWSEFRHDKWTQKQVSKEAVYDFMNDTSGKSILPDISNYKFVPKYSPNEILIGVEDEIDQDGRVLGPFKFNGSKIWLDSPDTFSFIDAPFISSVPPPRYFHSNNSKDLQFYPLQYNGKWLLGNFNPSPWVDDNNDTIDLNLTSVNDANDNVIFEFNHPYSTKFIKQISLGNVYDLLGIKTQEPLKFGNSAGLFHELKEAYSIYNWEIFFHSPAIISDRLSKSQQYEKSRELYHTIFNPLQAVTKAEEVWQFLPFRETANVKNVLEGIFNNLKSNQPDEAITEWRDKPFLPHVIARRRISAYMKCTVMKYIDNLIAWGDQLFKRDTIESINEATQLYILASHILGPRPYVIPKRGKVSAKSFMDLLDKWDAFSNAQVELELIFPFSNQISSPVNFDGKQHYGNIFGFATALYFCLPNNPKLLAYWDTVADRLFKIRHCMNIEGIVRKLPLFEPPIDPALLVQAAAQGISLSSVLNDLNAPMPNYRFNYLLQKALELCGELKSLAGAYLSAMEKKDNEALSLLRSTHDVRIQNMVMEIKLKQLEETQKSLEALQFKRKEAEYRLKHYQKLIGEAESLPDQESDYSEVSMISTSVNSEGELKLIGSEKEEMDKASTSSDLYMASQAPLVLANILFQIPQIGAAAKPLGVGIEAALGGINLGNMSKAIADGLQLLSTYNSHQSSSASRKGSYTRQLQDRIFQANLAGYSIKMLDKETIAPKIRIQIASQEITNQQAQIDHAAEVEDFMRSKYSTEQLYQWMSGQIAGIYRRAYDFAFDLAKKAEKVYRFEKGLSTTNFIQPGYWDNAHDGLLAGEQLYLSLKQLENAYVETRGHDYEVTKHISLLQIDPLALIELKETGKCTFAIPELLFDMDYPGHYKRRIKTVAVSVPCIVGPYTSLNCTLRLKEHLYRNTSIVSKGYAYQPGENDDDFVVDNKIPLSAIAVSQGQNDSGVFELNFKDERFMPFEGAGAASVWELELPREFRQFDYNTISDVIMHLRYTSCEGGARLQSEALKHLKTFVKDAEELGKREGLFRAFSLKHEFPNEWYRFLNPETGQAHELVLGNLYERLPFFAKHASVKSVTLNSAMVFTTAKGLNTLKLKASADSEGENLAAGARIGKMEQYTVESLSMPLKPQPNQAIPSWRMSSDNLPAMDMVDLVLVLKYAIALT